MRKTRANLNSLANNLLQGTSHNDDLVGTPPMSSSMLGMVTLLFMAMPATIVSMEAMAMTIFSAATETTI